MACSQDLGPAPTKLDSMAMQRRSLLNSAVCFDVRRSGRVGVCKGASHGSVRKKVAYVGGDEPRHGCGRKRHNCLSLGDKIWDSMTCWV